MAQSASPGSSGEEVESEAGEAAKEEPAGHGRKAGLLVALREYGITIGSLGSTAGQTVMVALLPVLMKEYAPSAFMIGLAIGAEGFFALFVPYLAGAGSDALPDGLAARFGRRSFFLMCTAPIMALSLAAAPFLHSYWLLFGAGLVFFAGLHAFLTPLWALMVDAVPDSRRGRVHGARGAIQSIGIGYGLVASGLMYELWRPLPFLFGAALIIATTALTIWAAPASDHDPSAPHDPAQPKPGGWGVALRRPAVRWFLIANALWTGSIDGIRPYVFLFAITVMGISVAQTSLVLAFLLIGLALGAVILGRLGDFYGRRPLLVGGLSVLAVSLYCGIFLRHPTGAALILGIAGVGAASMIALPFPMFVSLVGERGIGRNTGLYILSVGAARIGAPMLVGAAIDFGIRFYPEAQGYPMMWPMAGTLALLSVPTLLWSYRMSRLEEEAGAAAG